MKEELYQWIWNLAVFYILFTAILHLVPDGKYEKYVRFFMGLRLIFMMSTPVFARSGKGQELAGNFQMFYEKENRRKEEQELYALQKLCLQKSYLLELRKKIRESLQNTGIEVQSVEVNIKGEKIQAEITVKEEPASEQKGRIADELREECGLEEDGYTIQTAEHETGTMDRAASVGTSSGSSSNAGIR